MAKSIEGLKAASEFTQQIITLSTGAVAFSVTFLEKFHPAGTDKGLHASWALFACWGLFALAIGFAMLTLGALTGTLQAIDAAENGWPATAEQQAAAAGGTAHVDWSARAMMACFFLAVVAMGVAGVRGA